jgi:hypothetical protein
MDDVTTVRAGCDACGVSMTAAIVDNTIPSDVAQFFRIHAAHAMGRPGAMPVTTALPRPRFARGR